MKGFCRVNAGPLVFWLAVAFAWAIIGCNGWVRWRAIEAVTKVTVHQHALPKLDPKSATGYVNGLRTVILPSGLDSFHWIMNAQRMVHEGQWRIRTMPDDNMPEGRDMHWSHFLLWWIIALGYVHSWVTSLPIGASIESVAVWSTAPLAALLVFAIPFSIRKAFGWGAAALLSVAMAAVYPFASLFFVGSPDHHGLVAAALLCGALFLSAGGAGWVREKTTGGALPDLETSEKCFTASGMAVGIALWVSAATAIPPLMGLAAGVVLAGFFLLKNQENQKATYQPLLWRRWGLVGAGSSLFFYLLEYFPHHLGLRMEVNHPFYALALAGGGEWLYRVTRWQSGRQPLCCNRREILLLVGATLATSVAPAVIYLGGTSVFVVRDPFLWTLHRDYIHEFMPLIAWWRGQKTAALLIVLSPLVLQFFAVIRLVASRHLEPWRKSMLLLPSLAALSIVGLGFMQVRWVQSSDSLWLATLPTVVASAWTLHRLKRLVWVEKILAIVFVAAICLQMPQRIGQDMMAALQGPPQIYTDDKTIIFARDVAYRLRALGGRQVPVVASAPTTTTWMMYYGGMRGLGTLYWENVEGLKKGARLYSAKDDAAAQRLIREYGITYLVFLSMEPFVEQYPRLLRELPVGTIAHDTLAYRLSEAVELPDWAKDISVPIPGDFQPSWAAVYDVRSVLKKTDQ